MEIAIVILVIVGIFGLAIWQTYREASLSREAHLGYTIASIPMTYQEVKQIVNQAFPSLFWNDVPGRDHGIYKQKKMFLPKYSGMGPEVGILIDTHEDNENITDVSISLIHWETETYALFFTHYIGVGKTVKSINKLRKLLGDSNLIKPELEATQE